MNVPDSVLNDSISELELRSLFDMIHEFIVVKDGKGRLLFGNHTAMAAYGLQDFDWSGKTDLELAEYNPRMREEFLYNKKTDEMAWEKGEPIQIEKSLKGPDGAVQTWEVVKTPVFDELGRRHRLVIVSRNVTGRKIAEQALTESEWKYRLIAENMSDLVSLLETDGTIRYMSPSFRRILGIEPEELAGASHFQLVFSDDRGSVFRYLGQAMEEPGAVYKGEIRLQHAEGHAVWFEVSYSSFSEEGQGRPYIMASARDITERKKYDLQLKAMAYHDPLTDIPNRRFITDRLPLELEAAEARGSTLALLYLDVDGFKQINDGLGHAWGDQLLIQLVERVRSRLRSCDVMARIGGDEFVILLPNLSHQQTAVVAERICACLKQPWDLGGGRLVITTSSIGVAMFPTNGRTPETLLMHADQALYLAKKEGKSGFRFYA